MGAFIFLELNYKSSFYIVNAMPLQTYIFSQIFHLVSYLFIFCALESSVVSMLISYFGYLREYPCV